MLTLSELIVFLVALSSVAAFMLLLLRRFGLRIRRQLGCSCGGRGGKGKRWQGLAGDDEYDGEHDDDDAYDEEAGDVALDGIMRVVVQLSDDDEADEVELELTGLRHIADVKAAIASMYSEPGGEITLARQLVVQCDDDERGLTVALPGKTPIAQLLGVDHLLVKRRGKGDAMSEVGSTITDRKTRSVPTGGCRAAPARCGELHDLVALAARSRSAEKPPDVADREAKGVAGLDEAEAEAAAEAELKPESPLGPAPEPEPEPEPDTAAAGEATGAAEDVEDDGMALLDALARKIAERQGAAELAAKRSME